MLSFLTNNNIPRDVWSSFVYGHPDGNVFQTPEMFDVYCKASDVIPLALAVFQNDEIKGVLLAAIMTNGGALLKRFTARSIITGGPLMDDDTVLQSLLQEYRKNLPNYVVYSEIRPVFDIQSIAETLDSQYFAREGHYNLLMDIHQEESHLWERMHRERRRNVAKAQKAGLVFREIDTEEEIHSAIKLIIDTYHRKRVPMSYVKVLDKLKPILGNHVRFFAAFLGDKMLSCMVRLCYKGLFYSWFNGSDESYLKLYPNDFLTWNVIRLAHNEGYETYDFGGGGKPGIPYGVRDYKLKYGCEMYDYGRFVCVHHPLIFKLGKTAINILKNK